MHFLSPQLKMTSQFVRALRRRLLIGTTWPVAFLLAVATARIGYELALNWWKKKVGDAHRSNRDAVSVGLQKTLPLCLVLTFVLVPSIATLIFKAFLCDPIEYASSESATSTRRYLHDDLDQRCDSDVQEQAYDTEYARTRSLATTMVFAWPVGIPVAYALLLWASRKALLTGTETSLSRAIAFLTDDYDALGRGTFWWEPLEMCRKLTLTVKWPSHHERRTQ